MPKTRALQNTPLPKKAAEVCQTLTLVPDDVILATLSRDINVNDGNRCVCAWVLRESIARIRGTDASSVFIDSRPWETLHMIYGGNVEKWRNIYLGVVTSPEIARSNEIWGWGGCVTSIVDVEMGLLARLDLALSRS